MGSDESHFNVSVGNDGQSHKTVHKPQPFCRERRAEAVSNRGPSAYQPNALPLGQTGSQALLVLSCCFTFTEARWLIRDGGRVGRGRQSEGSTAETVRKRPERPWTAARTMEVLRRCPLAIAQRLVQCAIAVSTAVLYRVTKTMSVALLLTNNLDNSKQKMSNLLSPATPPYS